MESIIRDEIVQYLEANQLLKDSQHGFRTGRSCLTNILVFLDKITEWVDQGEMVDVVFLDFAKAFDKVPYQRLLLKQSGWPWYLEANCLTALVIGCLAVHREFV